MEKQVVHEMRVKRVGGTKEELNRALGERVKKIVRLCPQPRFENIPSSSYYFFLSRDQMLARRGEHFAEYRCRPWLTMLILPLTQLPLFVGS